MINLNLNGVDDVKIRDAFRAIQGVINGSQVVEAGLVMIPIEIKGAVTKMQVAHNLGYVPTDIIVSRSIGATHTFNWELFTNEFLYITTTGAVSLRCFVGRL